MNQFKYLQTKRKIYYSQNGEDGVLEYVLSKLPVNKWLVEFGAWDGKYLSNSYYLIEKLGYHAVLIEGDKDKMPDLRKNMGQFGERVIAMNSFVTPDGDASLDNLLSKTQIPSDFDLLSIDIDGMDYFVWKSLIKYKPKVVIVEINIKDKPGVDHIHDPKKTEYQWGESGSSIDSLTNLAHEKGYALLANVACNAIYIDKQYLNLFFDREPKTMEAYTYESFDLSQLNLTEAKYKGVFLQKLIRLPLHAIRNKN